MKFHTVARYGRLYVRGGIPMTLQKRTYSLPEGLLQSFEQRVPAGQRSHVLGELMRRWLEEQKRARLREEIARGLAEMSDVYREVEREFHPLEQEAYRVLENKPQKRRGSQGPARS